MLATCFLLDPQVRYMFCDIYDGNYGMDSAIIFLFIVKGLDARILDCEITVKIMIYSILVLI